MNTTYIPIMAQEGSDGNAPLVQKGFVPTNIKAHESLWQSMFKDETWLQLAHNEYGVNSGLLGSKVYKYYGATEKEYYDAFMVLLAGDLDGDLRWEQAKFFKSLQKHTYNETTHEITFDCGIVLNVKQVITGCDEIEMMDLQRLFKKDSLFTSYCFWADPDPKPRIITRPNIVGLGGRITRLKDIAPICALNLKPIGSLVPCKQQIFIQPGSHRLTPIIKDGTIKGWNRY
jgi:hypothetical protein